MDFFKVLLQYILAIFGLSLIVFVHELGHFILAKIFKIRVEEFGFGYPPRVCGLVRSSEKKFRFKFTLIISLCYII